MNDRPGYRLMPNFQDHKCFGCGPANPYGLQMKFYRKGESVFSWVIIPDHLCGWQNLAHGGVISAILDEIMARTAVYILSKMVMTKSITIDFIKPIFIGQEMKVEGRLTKSEIDNEREALVEGDIHNEKGVLCAKGTGVVALLPSDKLTKIGITDNRLSEDLNRLF